MTTPWWSPERHADRRPVLLARGRIQAALRGWLADEGFVEVDTAALQVSPGNEAHLHAFATEAMGNDGVARPMYLHTSPEFAMKKLLAAGETRIATFAHVWRNRERGALHSPEFTMLEWYRVGRGLRGADGRLRGVAAPGLPGGGDGCAAVSRRTCDPLPSRNACRWPRRFSAMPGSTCWRRSPRMARRMPRRCGRQMDRLATTTPGRTC